MRISVVDIEEAFAGLLNATRTREAVAEWASDVIRDDDAGGVQFEPGTAGQLLREAVHYLAGVDLRDGPSSYLHVEADFEQFLKEWRKKVAVNSGPLAG